MRNYVMSVGMNKNLIYFPAKDDGEAAARTISENAEYCIRLRGVRGRTMYTVLALGWNQ